ncbi:hypothetical protein CC80DRAFT_554611 [Byssothecium circinans]|uniref:Uncharacterized protein n=1 Tax=Byssothecium circinans TaxID=147558 RepID=A0A6A5TC31_9PLEO|nr:hypothetical protein CC80DRAFT_554611 [Byssothecium circinans]
MEAIQAAADQHADPTIPHEPNQDPQPKSHADRRKPALRDAPHQSIPFPSGPANITVLELLTFLPRCLQSQDVIERFLNNGGGQSLFSKMMKHQRWLAPEDNGILKTMQTAMRKNGPNEGCAPWNPGTHQVPEDWDSTSIAVTGFRVPVNTNSSDSSYYAIPFHELADGVRRFPSGPDALDLTRCVEYAENRMHEPWMYPWDYHRLLDHLGGPADVTYEHLDRFAFEWWAVKLGSKTWTRTTRKATHTSTTAPAGLVAPKVSGLEENYLNPGRVGHHIAIETEPAPTAPRPTAFRKLKLTSKKDVVAQSHDIPLRTLGKAKPTLMVAQAPAVEHAGMFPLYSMDWVAAQTGSNYVQPRKAERVVNSNADRCVKLARPGPKSAEVIVIEDSEDETDLEIDNDEDNMEIDMDITRPPLYPQSHAIKDLPDAGGAKVFTVDYSHRIPKTKPACKQPVPPQHPPEKLVAVPMDLAYDSEHEDEKHDHDKWRKHGLLGLYMDRSPKRRIPMASDATVLQGSPPHDGIFPTNLEKHD